MNLVELRNKIKSELDTLTGAGQPLSENHNYYKMDIESYPAVIFEPSTIESDYATTTENDRIYAFRMVALQAINKVVTHQEALNIICDITDKIIDHFDGNYLLDGMVKRVDAVPSSFDYVELEEGVVLASEIKISCVIIKDISV